MDPRLGHRVADLVGEQIARRRKSRLVRAVRANQWVVGGENGGGRELDDAVRETLRNSARAVFDLYHYLPDPEATVKMVVLEPSVTQLAAQSETSGRGLMLLGIHLCNFDLLLRRFGQRWPRLMVLTVPNPQGGRRAEYEMRRKTGMNLVPATVAGLRTALRHLEAGSALLTGIDRPISQPRLLPCFFGKPAALPVLPVSLAARAGVPMAVIAAMREGDGKYHVRVSDLIEAGTGRGGEDETLETAERVLRVAEGFIRLAPHQWSVPLPVWPSTLNLVPQ